MFFYFAKVTRKHLMSHTGGSRERMDWDKYADSMLHQINALKVLVNSVGPYHTLWVIFCQNPTMSSPRRAMCLFYIYETCTAESNSLWTDLYQFVMVTASAIGVCAVALAVPIATPNFFVPLAGLAWLILALPWPCMKAERETSVLEIIAHLLSRDAEALLLFYKMCALRDEVPLMHYRIGFAENFWEKLPEKWHLDGEHACEVKDSAIVTCALALLGVKGSRDLVKHDNLPLTMSMVRDLNIHYTVESKLYGAFVHSTCIDTKAVVGFLTLIDELDAKRETLSISKSAPPFPHPRTPLCCRAAGSCG